MKQIRVFVASSKQSLPIARIIQGHLTKDAIVKIWDEGDFEPGSYTLDKLLQIANEMDMCVCLFNDDDIINIQGLEYAIPRDNVILEFGLFVSMLDKERVIIVQPEFPKKGLKLRVPSDLNGLTVLTYDNSVDDEDLRSKLGSVCNTIRTKAGKVSKKKIQYLERFIKENEPPLTGGKPITKARIYELLVYMFQNEDFTEFRAFDLAFYRWEESLRDVDTQINNITQEIFSSMESLFKRVVPGAKLAFRRILVISAVEFQKQVTKDILLKINVFERDWCSRNKGLEVKTKIIIFDGRNDDLKKVFRLYNDYAIFTGSKEEFSIIEKLTSPEDRIYSPDCLIECDSNELRKRKDSFDYYWETALEITEVIERLSQNAPSAHSPVHEAFRRLERELKERELSNICLIVETSYVDLREPNTNERKQHSYDAFHLIDRIQTRIPGLRTNLLIDAFLNDFSLSTEDGLDTCNKANCKIDETIHETERRNTVRKNIIDRLKDFNKPFHISDQNFVVTGMRETRNKVVRKIEETKNDPAKSHFFESRPGSSRELNLKSGRGGPTNLGHYNAKGVLIPRCALLMAEHYFNLFEEAKRYNTQLEELWLIDFNKDMEAESVRQGAKVAFQLGWFPDNTKVTIINCNYYSNGRDGHIEISEGPANL